MLLCLVYEKSAWILDLISEYIPSIAYGVFKYIRDGERQYSLFIGL